ncbi:MAG: putative DNA-binding transcriptional regulator YafY [Oleiphilaceae bacterium]|jgi:predicted DNA-binding transcriptional regulator YafY
MTNKVLLAERLATILTALNAGDTLNIEALASEFTVSKRTIQRDINSRMAFLPLKRNGNDISLDSSSLGRLTVKDIRNFACLSGIDELFPTLDTSFITAMLTSLYDSPFLVKGLHYEDKSLTSPLLKKLSLAILNQHLVNFNYNNKCYSAITPYKLVNNKGIWYLAAVDNGKLKAFHLAKLVNFIELNECFIPDEATLKIIDEEDGIFFSADKMEVVLKVSAKVAHYFKRRDLLPNQVIEKELDDGDLLVSCKVATEKQIIPVIKYWMPDLEVISPKRILSLVRQDIDTFLSMSID